jgi:hypothetical protein
VRGGSLNVDEVTTLLPARGDDLTAVREAASRVRTKDSNGPAGTPS